MTTPADAESDTPPCVAIPWWRQRRRFFYFAVVFATLGCLWGGWHWWYRANFPMPLIWWLADFGIDVMRVDDWLETQQGKLVVGKMNRETRLLHLRGSAWQYYDNGSSGRFPPPLSAMELSFGRDGILRVKNPDSGLELLPRGLEPRNAETQAALAAMDGTPFDFQPEVLQVDMPGLMSIYDHGRTAHHNLILPDSPWRAILLCYFDRGRILIFLSPKDSTSELQTLYGEFTRLPDP